MKTTTLLKFRTLTVCVTLVGMGLGGAGCESNAGTGAIIGGLGGGALGAGIGSMSHQRAGEGALIGAAAGAIGGALIGHSMDESEKKKEREQASRAYSSAPAYGGAPVYSSTSGRVTKQDVIDWTARGTSDDLIIDRIHRSGTVFQLVAVDENQLRDAGVSETVLRAMKDTARR